MLSTSFEFRQKTAQSADILVKANLTLADGTERLLVGDDFMEGGMTFSDAVSSDSAFEVGAAVINKFSCVLNNSDGRFDEYDFTDAVIVPYLGVELDAGGVEWLRKGTYGVEQPETYGSTIGIEALDNMRLLEKDYSGVQTSYPATLGEIVGGICSYCDVTLDDQAFANHSYTVAERPDDADVSCIDMLSWAAQASGNWARFDPTGKLHLSWYDTATFEGEDWLDGAAFDGATPYASGDTADGGDFLDYTAGDEYDGGSFNASAFANVYAIKTMTVFTDDVVVTGVRVTAQDGVDEDDETVDGETYLHGTEGYVIEIGDNPLVLYGQASAVAAMIGARVEGMRFRPFDVSAVSDPAVEAGDPIIITDGKQSQYASYITSTVYKVGAYQSFKCGAETPGRNRADTYSAVTRAIVQARNALKRERTARERAIADLAEQLEESSGLYMTTQEQPDHSVIYYMHDKPTLQESQVVWKMTANAFGISTDGGVTYPYGLDASGQAILNRIYTIGLDADYITTGSISSQVSSTSWNLDTGSFANDFPLVSSLSYTAFMKEMPESLSDIDDAPEEDIRYGNVPPKEDGADYYTTQDPFKFRDSQTPTTSNKIVIYVYASEALTDVTSIKFGMKGRGGYWITSQSLSMGIASSWTKQWHYASGDIPDHWELTPSSPTSISAGDLLFKFEGSFSENLVVGEEYRLEYYYAIDAQDDLTGTEQYYFLDGPRWRFLIKYYHEYDPRLEMSSNNLFTIFAKVKPKAEVWNYYTEEKLATYVGQQGAEGVMGGFSLVNQRLAMTANALTMENGFGFVPKRELFEMGFIDDDSTINRMVFDHDNARMDMFLANPDEYDEWVDYNYIDAHRPQRMAQFCVSPSYVYLTGGQNGFGLSADSFEAVLKLNDSTYLQLTTSGLVAVINGVHHTIV